MVIPKLLIIDEETKLTDHYLVSNLPRLGYLADTLISSFDNLEQNILQFQPNLIITDLKTGLESQGLEIGRLLHNKFHIPFIYLISAYSRHCITLARETMPSGMLVKPFKMIDLIALLEITWQKHRAA